MHPSSASVTIVTPKLPETREFYEQFFDAQALFDCGWYVVLRLGSAAGAPEVCLKEPQSEEPSFAGGATLNLLFADADAMHKQFIEASVTPVMPLEDHPWGDRGFAVLDPAGVLIYCYHPIEPAPEFRQYFVESPT